MNKQIKNKLVPEQHLEVFKLSIAILNTAKALEEYTRELSSRIRMKERMISNGSATSVKKVEPISYISQLAIESINHDSLVSLNEMIDKFFVNRSGRSEVNNMAYELQEMMKDLFCLSINQQKEVHEKIKGYESKD